MNYLGIPETRSKIAKTTIKNEVTTERKVLGFFSADGGLSVSSLVHSFYGEELLDNLGTRKNHMRPM